MIPHITNEIKDKFYRAKSDDEETISIIEIGGTVGDMESQPFVEAVRQLQWELPKIDFSQTNNMNLELHQGLLCRTVLEELHK